MFLQSLGKYLEAKAERGELDDAYAYARASLLYYADWMVKNEYPYLDRPEKVHFPTETWPAQELRKCDALCLAALHVGIDQRGPFINAARRLSDAAFAALAQYRRGHSRDRSSSCQPRGMCRAGWRLIRPTLEGQARVPPQLANRFGLFHSVNAPCSGCV